MKIRTDFVTNSSSSSFIISLKEEIPENLQKFSTLFHKIETSKDIIEALGSDYELCYFNMSADKIQKYGKFTDDQMIIIETILNHSLDDFVKVKNILDNSEDNLYKITLDWDWSFDKKELNQFIKEHLVLTVE